MLEAYLLGPSTLKNVTLSLFMDSEGCKDSRDSLDDEDNVFHQHCGSRADGKYNESRTKDHKFYYDCIF